MNKPLVFGIGAGVLLLGIGIAAASEPPKKGPTIPQYARVALDAIRTGDAKVIQNAGVSLATTQASVAAGLVRTSQFIDSLKSLPADVSAAMVGSIRTVDPNQMLGVASVMQTRGYSAQALQLSECSKFVAWLQQGAPGAAPAIATGATTAKPTTGALPSITGLPTTAQGAASVALPASATVPMTTAEAQDIANAIATGDPAKIRAKAAEYRKKGRADIADALEEAAKKVEQALQSNAAVPTFSPEALAAAAQAAGVPSATATPQAGTAPGSSEKMLASKTALALRGINKSWKGTSREPRTMVQAFQQQEKLARLDGSYGSETALALAERYGIVPPVPIYWGAKGGDYRTLQADQALYKSRIARLAKNDPQRADEWSAAAKV